MGPSQVEHGDQLSREPLAPSTAPASGTRTMVVVGFAMAAVGLLILPIVFCPAAVILGIMALRRGDPLGRWVIVAGVAAFVAAIAVAATLVDDVQERAGPLVR